MKIDTLKLIGQQINDWTILSLEKSDIYGNTIFKCKCKCGIEKLISYSKIKIRKRCKKCSSIFASTKHNHGSLTDEELIYQYIVLFKSASQIAKETGRQTCSITERLKNLNITKRTNKDYTLRKLNKEIGQKFNKLLILKRVESTKKSHIRYLCQCDCGKEWIGQRRQIIKGYVKSCGCFHKSPQNNGYKNLYGSTWNKIVECAKKRGIEFNINIKDAYFIYEQQNEKCALSGRKIGWTNSKIRSASLDRIDSTKGYTKDNIQWVHKDINKMKMDITQKEFIKLCKEITKFQENKNEDSMSA